MNWKTINHEHNVKDIYSYICIYIHTYIINAAVQVELPGVAFPKLATVAAMALRHHLGF